MLKLGEKGAILQRDKETYAIAPHIPCGVVSPDLLRRLADVAEKYGAKALKITGATRIAVVGLKEEDIDSVWEELALTPGAAVGLCVRSVRACPGTSFCKLGQQDALGMGLKLDEIYHGMELPGKFKMSVSGCGLNCAESWVRDVGLVGKKDGWMLTIGGNVGASSEYTYGVHIWDGGWVTYEFQLPTICDAEITGLELLSWLKDLSGNGPRMYVWNWNSSDWMLGNDDPGSAEAPQKAQQTASDTPRAVGRDETSSGGVSPFTSQEVGPDSSCLADVNPCAATDWALQDLNL